MILGFGNNVQGAIASNITAAQTVIPVIPGTGALFAATLVYDPIIPGSISGSVPIYSKVTLTDQQETVFEICHLLSVSGDNLTVIRGREGTTAKGWSLNDTIANFATAGSENKFVQVEEMQRGFYLSSVATGTANALVISLPSTLGENSVAAATANWHAPVLITPASTNTGSVTLTASAGLLNFPTNAPVYKGRSGQLSPGDIQSNVPFLVLWSESAQAWYMTGIYDQHGIVRATSSGSTIIPAGVTTITLSGCAGGGGGGGGGGSIAGTNLGSGGGGGGAGQALQNAIYTVTPGSTISWTIGAGGTKGIGVSGANGTAGTSGGNTVITGIPSGTITLTGGGGGSGGISGVSPVAGTIGGTGFPRGGSGSDAIANGSPCNGAFGGSSPFGGGGSNGRGGNSGAPSAVNNGSDADGFGGGGGSGGGYYTGGATQKGGDGGNGTAGFIQIGYP